jgi:hypothetical protein
MAVPVEPVGDHPQGQALGLQRPHHRRQVGVGFVGPRLGDLAGPPGGFRVGAAGEPTGAGPGRASRSRTVGVRSVRLDSRADGRRRGEMQLGFAALPRRRLQRRSRLQLEAGPCNSAFAYRKGA